MTTNRRLAAIMVADVVGYSRMMEQDEVGTLAALKERRKRILEPVLRAHGGRIVKVMGDGVLLEFASAVNAVQGAIELQMKMAEANDGVAEDRRIVLRIGINLGDVIGEGSDIYGEGVNIAARVEPLAEPGGICVSGKVHEEVRGKVNAAMIDLGERPLKNIEQPVRVYRCDIEALPLKPSSSLTKKPSIAVLPFQNMSDDPSQQYISDGITEDLTTELARFSGLSVASRQAAFHYGGKGKSLDEVARALGAAFLVEGSVRKSGGRIRITAQLIDARSGKHVWADRYDRNSEDVFAIQDQVVSSIVSMLEGRMVAVEAARLRSLPTASWSAYDCLLQGRELCNNYREPEAAPLFARAVAIDPQFALAHAWLAIALIIGDFVALDDRRIAEADSASKRALELDSSDSTSQWARALYFFWTGQLERAEASFDRAMVLNPADIQIRGDYANWQRASGNPSRALATIDQALSLGPFVPVWFNTVRGLILFDLKRYAEAADVLENIPVHYHSGYLYLAATYTYLDKKDDAARAIIRVRERISGLTLSVVARVIRYGDDCAKLHFLDGLRKAGLPE